MSQPLGFIDKVRQGNSAGEPSAGPSSFDTQLWERINALECTLGMEEFVHRNPKPFPNPTHNILHLEGVFNEEVIIYDLTGRPVLTTISDAGRVDVGLLIPGTYLIGVSGTLSASKFVKL